MILKIYAMILCRYLKIFLLNSPKIKAETLQELYWIFFKNLSSNESVKMKEFVNGDMFCIKLLSIITNLIWNKIKYNSLLSKSPFINVMKMTVTWFHIRNILGSITRETGQWPLSNKQSCCTITARSSDSRGLFTLAAHSITSINVTK